ncbi:MAG: UDP-N-acetylmuramoyl-L-alanine--D-glutamate ligase [Clostridia bacterium]|nr:UDP-N-acetylmuramoyl-L-alanine--D-glutamate ligase [Clostridia bacterium]
MTGREWRKRLDGARCTVIGLGVSNRPLVDFLLSHGALVTVCDRKSREELGDVPAQLEARGVVLRLGEGYLDAVDGDFVFRSPGLRPDHPALLAAVDRGAILSSEMELFFALCPAKMIGITGSDGKTTTTTLTGLMLEQACRRRGCGRVFVGGNIGRPLLSAVDSMCEDDFCVVELSSFQLQTMKTSPCRAAVTNVTPNHLDWHTGMEEYVAAKKNLYQNVGCERFITNAENAQTRNMAAESSLPRTLFSSQKSSLEDFGDLLCEGDRALWLADGKIMAWDGRETRAVLDRKDLFLPGVHNVENCMTAIALTDGWVSDEDIFAVASTFQGVEHRLEPVRELDGVTYYNSSIDSSPARTAAALSALAPRRPIVICGGYDKKIPFAPLADALCKHAKAVVLTGATAPKILEALKARPEVEKGMLPIYPEPDFTKAVTLARGLAERGDIVLLSPACASFDAFPNFAVRGETFRKIVQGF